MKLKAAFKGALQEVPQRIQKSFQLNDHYHSAKITLDDMGNYGLSVPYGITDATARRSVYYKPAMEEITRQMVHAYSNATKSFSEIASKCSAIETDILYQRRLQNLQLETYTKRSCPEPKPTKKAIEKELLEEADKKFYRLFSNRNSEKKQYVSENLETVYADRLRHWEEVVTYHDYVESVIAAKKNKEYLEKFNKEKSDLENKLYGPDSYVKQQLGTILNDKNIPLINLPFELDYDRKQGLIDIVVDMPFDLPVPKISAQLYASGKLWVKAKQGRDIANERLSFYLGLSFYLASKLFGLALNICKVRVSLVEHISSQGISWLEFEREPLRQLIVSGDIALLSTANTYNHYFELDNVSGIKRIHSGQFNQKVNDIIDRSSSMPQHASGQKHPNNSDISLSDAKLLAASIYDNKEIIDAIKVAEQNQINKIAIPKGLVAMLEEIKTSHTTPDQNVLDELNDNPFCEYGAVEYREYNVTEHIVENDPGFSDEMKAFIQRVVDEEAPISRDVLNRRICSAMGISRVSARLNEVLTPILCDLSLFSTTEGKLFFWSDSVRPSNFKAYRIGGNRDALDLPVQEVANCIVCVARDGRSLDKDSILRETANKFGFTRMGVNVQAAMGRGLQHGVDNGIVKVELNKIISSI